MSHNTSGAKHGLYLLTIVSVIYFKDLLKGAGGLGVPWDQIMENKFEYLSDRGLIVVI